ncbi:helix-turn-helix domain-containing protein [Streptomyces sp. NPDC050560]|uniref:helix-turn-helix domain-containing protein n=1 Tax=Streptomyces sp. NPDC050560 TaxID=3365630 RepID=UPI00378F71F0
MLGAIGLDEVHESAYRALVTVGAADVRDLARRLTLGEYDTERALRRLEHQGLAARSSDRPERWVAAPPRVALGALLTKQRHDLEQAEMTAAVLAEEYRSRAAEPTPQEPVEVVTGARAVDQRLLQLRRGAAHEVCALVTGRPPMAAALGSPVRETAGAPGAAGAGWRVVVERAALASPAESWGPAGSWRVRVADALPADLVVADGALAMVPLGAPGGGPAALVVHAGGLLATLTALFEAVWRQALPLRLGAGGEPGALRPAGPDGTDLAILSLLLAGLTDASVAKQLDLGLRTVQRRVKHLMDLAGVTTRLQLGWHAYERGWIARDGA